jgi:hypothetical protein
VTRRVALTALVAVAVLPWMLASLTSADAAGQGSDAAARLVDRMRAASSDWSFGGTVALEWRDTDDASKTHTTTVDVKATYGAIEVVAGSTKVEDQYGFTVVTGDRGVPNVLLSPITRTLPSADHAWTLSTRPATEIAGRPTTVVVATRRDRSAAQRLYIDTETNLFLGRDVLDAKGRVERALRFTSFHVDGGPQPTSASGSGALGGTATLRHVPDGYRAPAATAGYKLIAATKGDAGGVQLSYSDGIFTVSISERLGDLDWAALASGGAAATVAGHRARTYSEPGADVVVWEGDGVVYTCVSDAPMDVTAAMIAGLSPSGRSAIEKAVDFVLGPFSWS